MDAATAPTAPPATVRAAGGVLWRPAADGAGVEVALVHRPRYDDWSLPKGKQDPGELLRETAARELREETGFRVALGRDLGTSHYPVLLRGQVVPKTVRWWSARCLSGAFVPGPEVDALEWCSPEQAAGRLTAGRDGAVLAELTRLPVQAGVRVLVRHARAGRRADWDGDDALRPLDARGRRQAQRLADLLELHGVTCLVSAPPLRCRQTLQPLAERLGLPVQVEPLLGDEGRGACPADALALVRALPPGTVACSQGDALPALLRGLRDGTEAAADGPATRRGAGHVLTLVDGVLRACDPLDLEEESS